MEAKAADLRGQLPAARVLGAADDLGRRVKETSGWELTEEVRRLGFH